MDLKRIGENVRTFRIKRRLKQEDLAERAGLSTKYIGVIERGEKIPSLETFCLLSNALEVSADILLKGVFEDSKEKTTLNICRIIPQNKQINVNDLYNVVDSFIDFLLDKF